MDIKNKHMVTLYNDTVILRSKKHVDVTINATTMYHHNMATNMYDIVALVRGKMQGLVGDIELYPHFNVKDEETAKRICQQFVLDVKVMSLNRPNKYRALLKSVEHIAETLPEDKSSMENAFIMFSIPKRYAEEDNPLLYRN